MILVTLCSLSSFLEPVMETFRNGMDAMCPLADKTSRCSDVISSLKFSKNFGDVPMIAAALQQVFFLNFIQLIK